MSRLKKIIKKVLNLIFSTNAIYSKNNFNDLLKNNLFKQLEEWMKIGQK